MSPDHAEDNISIHDMPQSERPRERLFSLGAASLSSAELLAVILRTGTAEENILHLCNRLLAHFDGLQGLAEASPAELQQINGLGTAKVAQIVAALEIGRRLTAHHSNERALINTAADAARLLRDMRHLSQEHVRVILLDMSRRVIAIPTVYIGTLNVSVLRVSEIFREAIARNSPAIILAHNHPSGDPNPSPEDIELTRTLIAAGELLDIALVDHLIIGQQDWRSLKNMGLGFKS
jgi:DNA repair protein RadC